MWRRVHSVLSLVFLVIVLALAVSGTILSVYPVVRAADAASIDSSTTVADIAGPLAANLQGIESIVRSPSGQITVNYSTADWTPVTDIVDPSTGAVIGPVPEPQGFYAALKDFHRAFLLGDNGRIAAGIGAAVMAMLSLSGLTILVSRMGGWRRIFDTPKGSRAGRLHTVLTRLALLPFLLSSLTACYMVLVQFELVKVTETASVAYPESTQGLPEKSPGDFAALAAIPLNTLIKLQFPYAGDTYDVYTLRTTSGVKVIDQFTGEVLEEVPTTRSEAIYGWFYALHTGEGLAWVGALLGLAASLVPAIAAAGVVIWWQRRSQNGARVAGNAAAGRAEIVVLVGSESGATWGFARTLHKTLTAAGKTVHLGPMDSFNGHYPMANHVLFLTSTYGDGHAPESASKALARLALQTELPKWRYSVLGFGDRAFPKFCQFAKTLDQVMEERGWTPALPTTLINRQSVQAFASWGKELGQAIGVPLTLNHTIATPPTRKLTLIDRKVYGEELQAPTAVLTFRLSTPPRTGGLLRVFRMLGTTPHFAPTDLLGVIPPSETVPRYYSISSSASETEVEICVRKQEGGLCSGMLHRLAIGDEIDAFVRPNPDFAPPARRNPVIMVSAGTGIAPFAGIIRDNRRKRPLHLFWGGRSAEVDFLYEDVLNSALQEGELTTLTTAFSRSTDRAYVQDKLRQEAPQLAALLKAGAYIMVCGGDAMAQAVKAEFETVLESIGSSVHALKQRGRYLEDVF